MQCRYRLFYIGGRWMAQRGVGTIELYNEPDKDTDCLTPTAWADDVRVRSLAVQDAFSDSYARPPTLIAPTTSVGWEGSYS
jgi:hypothetical protein